MPKGKKLFNLWIAGLILVGLLVTIYAYHEHINKTDCTAEYRQDSVILSPNGTKVAVEIAADPQAQMKGLSGRQCIAKDWGMLFSFRYSGILQFWMKDMNFPIDIVWVNENFEVVGVEEAVSPDTYPKTFSSPTPVKYVLEVGAHQAGSLGLSTGSTITL